MKTYHYQNLSVEDIPGEKWAFISGYEERYLVSNMGRIKISERTEITNNKKTIYSRTYKCQIAKQTLDKLGYLRIGLWFGANRKQFSVHRIVAECFLKNDLGLPIVMHEDNCPSNNIVSNLSWGTQSDNIKHAYKCNRTVSYTKGKKGSELHWSIPVSQYDLNGNFIRSYESMQEAKSIVGINAHIGECINNKRLTTKGFIWKRILEAKTK